MPEDRSSLDKKIKEKFLCFLCEKGSRREVDGSKKSNYLVLCDKCVVDALNKGRYLVLCDKCVGGKSTEYKDDKSYDKQSSKDIDNSSDDESCYEDINNSSDDESCYEYLNNSSDDDESCYEDINNSNGGDKQSSKDINNFSNYDKQPSKDSSNCVDKSNEVDKEFNKDSNNEGYNTCEKLLPKDSVLSFLFSFTITSHILSSLLFLCLLFHIYNEGCWSYYGCYMFYKVSAFYIFSKFCCLFLPTWYICRGKASTKFIIKISILLIIFIILEYSIWSSISPVSCSDMVSLMYKSFMKFNVVHTVVNVTLLSIYLLCRRFN